MRRLPLSVLTLLLGLTVHSQAPPPLSPETQARLKERDLLSKQAQKLQDEGKLVEAIAATTKMLAIERAVLGSDHEDVLGSLKLLAELHEGRNDWTAARLALQEALKLQQKRLGELHWQTADTRRALADLARREGLTATQRRRLREAGRALQRMETLKAQGKFAEAIKLARTTVKTRGELLGTQHPDYATSVNYLGFLHASLGDYARAEPFFRQALEVRKQAVGERHPHHIQSLTNLGALHQARGEHDRAEPLLRQAVALSRETLGEQHVQHAESLTQLAMLSQSQGKYGEAEPLHQKSLKVRQQALGENCSEYAAGLNNLAFLYLEQGKHDQAEPLLTHSLEITRRLVGERHADYATGVNNLAGLCYGRGEYGRAEPLFLQALEIRRQVLGERHALYAQSLRNLAMLYDATGEAEKAEPFVRRALEVRRQMLGERHPDYAESLTDLADLYKKQGAHARADQLYHQALAIRRQALGDRHPAIARSLAALAGLHGAIGDHASAERLHRQALAIVRQALGAEHPEHADSLFALARVQLFQREYGRAEPLLRQALAIQQRALGASHPDCAGTLQTLGGLYLEQGELARAEPLLRQALAIRRQALGDKHPDYADNLNTLAILHSRQQDYERAEACYQQGLSACAPRTASSAAPEQLAATDFRLDRVTLLLVGQYAGFLHHHLGSRPAVAQLRRCDLALALALEVRERYRGEVLTDEVGKLLHGGKDFDLFSLRLDVCRRLYQAEARVEHLQAAFTTAEQGTARVFLDSLGRGWGRRLAGIPAAALAREQEALRAVQLAQLRLDWESRRVLDRRRPALIARLSEEVRAAEARLRQVVAQLQRDYPRFADLKYPRPCSLAEARACLGAKEVALLFVPGSEQSWGLLLEARPARGDPAEGLLLFPVPPEADLADLAAALTDRDILEKPARSRAVGRQAYQQLLAPLAERLRGKDLVIVAGGPLGYLPFELLVGPEGRYLVEQHRIRHAVSLTALHLGRLWEQQRPRPEQPLWALGDPVFEADDPRVAGRIAVAEASRLQREQYLAQLTRGGSSGHNRFDRLPATAAEVAALQRLLKAGPQATATGLLASEATLKAASAKGVLARTRYVHLATHGILGSDQNRQPALVLSLVGNEGEDGFLTLEEVTSLKLNADLVVLSACQSGQGRLYRGEGVSSLARGFLYAGSRGVVCSLWSVADAETATLMAAMYGQLQAGKASADALRAAKLDMIAAGKPPFFWAPFILIGE